MFVLTRVGQAAGILSHILRRKNLLCVTVHQKQCCDAANSGAAFPWCSDTTSKTSSSSVQTLEPTKTQRLSHSTDKREHFPVKATGHVPLLFSGFILCKQQHLSPASTNRSVRFREASFPTCPSSSQALTNWIEKNPISFSLQQPQNTHVSSCGMCQLILHQQAKSNCALVVYHVVGRCMRKPQQRSCGRMTLRIRR